MKYLACGILLFLALSPAIATAGDRWEREDYILQATWSTIHVIDWVQTRRGLDDGYSEGNPIMGTDPSIGTVNTYFAATLIGHALISVLLPKETRPYWQMYWIGASATIVGHNMVVGVRLRF